MIERLTLTRYKGFEKYNLKLAKNSILVGPNNAGKSTSISALRLCSSAISHARRRNPSQTFYDGDRQVLGYPLAVLAKRDAEGFISENVRYEFHDDEPSRLDLQFKNEASLSIVWPTGETSPFFYVDRAPGMLVRTNRLTSQLTDTVGIVPTLSPIEQQEKLLSETYINKNLISKLTSRHFRNQLYYLRSESEEDYDGYIKFALDNTPELTDLRLIVSDAVDLDIFYREIGTRIEKELVWAGDGLQIWLQALYHIFRQAHTDALVLDEPDVFLHPDLQRRLVGILEHSNQQVIFATHAPEILTEASRDSIIWVDRTRSSSKRVQDEKLLAQVNTKLGSGFNLEMARALRSKVALFVEGEDMKVLRNLARTAGAQRLSTEQGVAVIRLRGFTNWSHVEPFAWMTRDLLGNAIQIYVILDRDYRTNEQVHDVVQALRGCGVHPHVWNRKELESYLLVPSAMSRISGATEDEIGNYLESAAQEERDQVFANYLFERKQTDPAKHDVTHVKEALPDFNNLWSDPATRLNMVPPKDVLNHLNVILARYAHRTISIRNLSSRLRLDEISYEMINLFEDIEGRL